MWDTRYTRDADEWNNAHQGMLDRLFVSTVESSYASYHCWISRQCLTFYPLTPLTRLEYTVLFGLHSTTTPWQATATTGSW